jgi:hypothetical protein
MIIYGERMRQLEVEPTAVLETIHEDKLCELHGCRSLNHWSLPRLGRQGNTVM